MTFARIIKNDLYSGKGIMLFCIFISIAIRLYNIDSPFDVHVFRQAQTAITVQNFINEGVSILKYKTPVFGDASIIPFEFPTFQLSCFAVHKRV